MIVEFKEGDMYFRDVKGVFKELMLVLSEHHVFVWLWYKSGKPKRTKLRTYELSHCVDDYRWIKL